MKQKNNNTKHKLRVMFNTNSPFTYSGYAQTMNEIYLKIKDEGYPLALINFYGQHGYVKEIDGVIHYPAINMAYGDDAMVQHGKDFKADVVITNQDIWTLDPNFLKQIPRWVPWVPIDHDPVPPPVLERLRLAYRVLPCAKFGQDQLKIHNLASTYIPYTVDTNIFKPFIRNG